jgi:hypothetical protein
MYLYVCVQYAWVHACKHLWHIHNASICGANMCHISNTYLGSKKALKATNFVQINNFEYLKFFRILKNEMVHNQFITIYV